jgi:hypothetical protein
MAAPDRSASHRQVLVYFGLMSLLVNLVNPTFLLDIPTSYMLKNILHAPAARIALFRLLTGIPFYLAFAFGLARDLWNPFGQRDPGYFRVFVPLMVSVLAWMASRAQTSRDCWPECCSPASPSPSSSRLFRA